MKFPDDMDNRERLKALIAEWESDEPDESIDRLTLSIQAVWLSGHLVDQILDTLRDLDDRISELERRITAASPPAREG